MKFATDIIRLLKEYPDNWIPGKHYITWKCEGPPLKLWICNGGWFCQTYDCGYPDFPIIQRWRLWFAFKAWRNRYWRLNPGLPNQCCSAAGEKS